MIPYPQHARVFAGIVDGGVHIHLLFGAPLLRGELPQGAERHLELPGIQRVVLAEVPELPLPRHHHGSAVAALPADADTVGVPAAITPWGAALCAYPIIAAVMLLCLLFQPFLQHFQQFFQCFVRESGGTEVLNGALQILAGMVQPVQ